MLDMTQYVEEQDGYITGLEINKLGNIVVTYASGRVEEEKYSKHNHSYYQDRMVKQAITFTSKNLNTLGIDWIKAQAVRFGSLIGGAVGLYFLYNVDIHIIMKILITILVLLGEAAQLFFTELYLRDVEDESLETFAYDEYLKHLDNFRYYNKETGTTEYIMPIEDISTHQMTSDFVKNINGTIEQMKSLGSNIEDIHLSYSKIKEHPSK